MRRALPPFLALALALAPAAAPAGPPRAEGRIQTDEGRLEILGQPVRVGETIELPEGFLRVEEAGTEDRNIGSFTVVAASSITATATAAGARRAAEPAAPREGRPAAFLPVRADGPCRTERGAYVKELWKLSGIEISDPDALLLGLDGGDGAAGGFYWFALATDPFRPLAWSSALRERAEALARCVRGR